MFTITKAWLWIKQNWKVPAVVLWTIVVWIFSRKNAEVALEVLDVKKQSYEKQIAFLKQAHKKELSEKDKLVIKYHDTIEKLEKEFSQKEKELTEKEKKLVKEIIEESKDNPDEVKRKVEDLFGFDYVD
tara:strand:+ start:4318 stop:4704 length:387 start_codon:yes stop_codon:yes gene_type:complete